MSLCARPLQRSASVTGQTCSVYNAFPSFAMKFVEHPLPPAPLLVVLSQAVSAPMPAGEEPDRHISTGLSFIIYLLKNIFDYSFFLWFACLLTRCGRWRPATSYSDPDTPKWELVRILFCCALFCSGTCGCTSFWVPSSFPFFFGIFYVSSLLSIQTRLYGSTFVIPFFFPYFYCPKSLLYDSGAPICLFLFNFVPCQLHEHCVF